MNDIINTFLLAGDKFMPEMHLKQPGFTYSASGPFTKNKERIKKFMQTGNTDLQMILLPNTVTNQIKKILNLKLVIMQEF